MLNYTIIVLSKDSSTVRLGVVLEVDLINKVGIFDTLYI